MQRREFVKNALCISCMGVFASGCGDIFSLEDNNDFKDFDYKKSRFYYKTEDELPKKIRLEACSLCQLKCPECTVRKLENQMPKNWLGYLKFSDFKKFIDRNNFIKEIELSNNGEIFLNPELDEIIKYAYQKNINLTADAGVNLNTASNKTLENLVKYQFKLLRVSIDGATAETYKIYRRGGDFNTVINNIKKINEFKKKYNSEYPRLTYQFILFGHNEHEIEKAKKLAKELDMKIEFKRNMSVEYSPIKNEKLVEKQTGLKIYKEKKKLIKNILEKQKLIACRTLFDVPQIDFNGRLLGCCHITRFDFGANAFKKNLLNALNAPDFIYAKHMLTDLSVKPKENLPCNNCSRYKMFKETGQPLIV